MAGPISLPIVSKFDPTGIRQAQKALGGFGKSLMGFGALVAGAFAIRAIGNFAAETIRMAEEVQQSEAVLRQVAKTTGVFGNEVDSVTKRLIEFANAQELRIGVDSEVIKVVQAQLLSFKALSASAGQAGGTFDRATKAAFDMAMVLKKDASAQAIALGKALENPIKGVTALARGGTTFTDQQREQIRTLVESNRLLDAQALILTEVESQYGGAAEAGALYSDRFRLGLEQIKETIGIALIPSFERFVEFFITDVVPPLTKFFEQDFPVLLEKLKPLAEDVMTFFGDVGQGLKNFLDIDADTSLIEGVLDKFNEIGANPEFQTFLGNVKEIFDEMAPVLADIVFDLGEMAVALTPVLEGALGKVGPLLSDTAGVFSNINYFLGEIVKSFGAFEGETPDFIQAIENQLNPIDRLRELMKGLLKITNDLIAAYKRFRDLGGRLPSETVTGGKRFGELANGGRATGGLPYLVGEMGPELFMPGRGGNVVPNDRLGSMGGGTSIVINVTAGMGTNGAQVGEQIVNAIKRYERVSGPVFASA
jgi:hypothetical protein